MAEGLNKNPFIFPHILKDIYINHLTLMPSWHLNPTDNLNRQNHHNHICPTLPMFHHPLACRELIGKIRDKPLETKVGRALANNRYLVVFALQRELPKHQHIPGHPGTGQVSPPCGITRIRGCLPPPPSSEFETAARRALPTSGIGMKYAFFARSSGISETR